MSSHESLTDPILRLAWRIARRADELARETSFAHPDLRPWLWAEEEILGRRLPEPAVTADALTSDSLEPAGAEASP